MASRYGMSEGEISLKITESLVFLMLRKQLINQADLENIVAALNLKAHEQPESREGIVSGLSAIIIKEWLLAPSEDDLPNLLS